MKKPNPGPGARTTRRQAVQAVMIRRSPHVHRGRVYTLFQISVPPVIAERIHKDKRFRAEITPDGILFRPQVSLGWPPGPPSGVQA